jgi:hypothetical protein
MLSRVGSKGPASGRMVTVCALSPNEQTERKVSGTATNLERCDAHMAPQFIAFYAAGRRGRLPFQSEALVRRLDEIVGCASFLERR